MRRSTNQAWPTAETGEGSKVGVDELRQAWLDAEQVMTDGRDAASDDWLAAAEWWLHYTRREYADAMATPRSESPTRVRSDR